MVVFATLGPDGWIVQLYGASSEQMAEGSARDGDRLAELVAYTLLGAAINGFVPHLGSAGGIRSSGSTRVPHVPAPPVPVGHRRRRWVAALFPHRLCS